MEVDLKGASSAHDQLDLSAARELTTTSLSFFAANSVSSSAVLLR